MITIVKILNNNCILVKDENEEKIFMGKGIGFGLSRNNNLIFDSYDKIEKIFILQNK